MILALAFALAAAGHPDATPTDAGVVEARALFEQGRGAYDAGRFEVARAWFRLAWDKKKLPELLFNIAQCDFVLGEHDDAIRNYERYLVLAPAAPNRALVEELIAESKAALSARPPPSAMDHVRGAVNAIIPASLRGDGSAAAPSPSVQLDGDEPLLWALAAGTVTVVAVGVTAWALTQQR